MLVPHPSANRWCETLRSPLTSEDVFCILFGENGSKKIMCTVSALTTHLWLWIAVNLVDFYVCYVFAYQIIHDSHSVSDLTKSSTLNNEMTT